ncbi:MAG: cation diffusion facilitator family transporter [Candidatus Marinimicrobia bacterium]|nr:cation diffusion facilitator family transporter [Candidatus Neomarinimicrobiota bacterium]
MGHDHTHLIQDKNRILIALFLNLLIVPLEIYGGIYSGSFSLLSDGIHMISHFGILAFAYFAEINSRYQKYSVFINGFFLTCLSFFILFWAIWKIIHPSEILCGVMFKIALVGLIADISQIVLLYPAKSHHGVNMKSVFLHTFSDAGLSFAIVVGSICVHLWKFYQIDSIILFLFFPFVLFSGIKLIKISIKNPFLFKK